MTWRYRRLIFSTAVYQNREGGHQRWRNESDGYIADASVAWRPYRENAPIQPWLWHRKLGRLGCAMASVMQHVRLINQFAVCIARNASVVILICRFRMTYQADEVLACLSYSYRRLSPASGCQMLFMTVSRTSGRLAWRGANASAWNVILMASLICWGVNIIYSSSIIYAWNIAECAPMSLPLVGAM